MRFASFVLALLFAVPSVAQQPGSLLICGGGAMPDEVIAKFRSLAGKAPRLIVVPTASSREPDVDETTKLWRERGFEDVRVLHTRDKGEASTEEFCAPLRAADAVWFGGGAQQSLADAYVGTRFEQELHELLKRGGVIGGTSAGAAIQSRVMIASGAEQPKISVGFDLLPGTIIDQHFLRRNRLGRLFKAVTDHPDRIGLGIDEGTAVLFHQGRASAIGDSYVIRIRCSDSGEISHDAYRNGDEIPLGIVVK